MTLVTPCCVTTNSLSDTPTCIIACSNNLSGSNVSSSLPITNVPQLCAVDCRAPTSRCTHTASNGSICKHETLCRGVKFPTGKNAKSKGPSFFPISRNAGQHGISSRSLYGKKDCPRRAARYPDDPTKYTLARTPINAQLHHNALHLPSKLCWPLTCCAGQHTIFTPFIVSSCHQSSSIMFSRVIPYDCNVSPTPKGTTYLQRFPSSRIVLLSHLSARSAVITTTSILGKSETDTGGGTSRFTPPNENGECVFEFQFGSVNIVSPYICKTKVAWPIQVTPTFRRVSKNAGSASLKFGRCASS
mmetsp:Transcript_8008/g.14244  ORF Transcript_8008/g.14244 Transcript_8008/m.14244 type:complete len:302 (+) Transcript_8008:137-1042(+)